MKPILQQSEIRKDAVRMLRAIARQPNLLIDTAECLPTFERPALVVWASEDRVMPPEHGRRLPISCRTRGWSRSPAATPVLPLGQPVQCTRAIREFMAETPVDVPAPEAESVDPRR
jgi:pimeloyl-ACP methyl ester carboxylesterase